MTDRERDFATLGVEYAEGIEQSSVVVVPATGREICKNQRTDQWEAQPWNDNYWKSYSDLLDALREATPPGKRNSP